MQHGGTMFGLAAGAALMNRDANPSRKTTLCKTNHEQTARSVRPTRRPGHSNPHGSHYAEKTPRRKSKIIQKYSML
jgi:hypothetical protein